MSRYGVDYYGQHPTTGKPTYYGELVINEFDASPFEVAGNGYGKALATWRKPGGSWQQQKLVRNSTGVPLDENDGQTVLDQGFDASTRTFQDTGLTPGRFYYYALFVLDAHELIWRRAGSGIVLTTKDWGYTDRLYRRLPDVFKSSDYKALDQALVTDENSFLYRYLSVFGYQLDQIRTETETLRYVLDGRTVSAGLLPALAAQVGINYEPEIGARAVRRLVTNAVHLWSLKGTLPGVRELASLVTGYPATVRVGYNLALDNLDAGPDGDVGRWTGRLDCKVTYQTDMQTEQLMRPAGEGVLVLTPTKPTQQMVADMNPIGESGRPAERLRFAIPVVPGLPYVASQYLATKTPGLSATMRIQWLDARGRNVLTDPVAGDPVGVGTDFSTRVMVQDVAPVNARFLEASVSVVGSMSPTMPVLACGFMAQEYGPVRPWKCSREVLIYLQAELINYIGNTSGHDGSAYGWSAGVGAAVDGSGQSYLNFTPAQVDGGAVSLLDTPGGALVVVTGDTAPPATAAASGPRQASYDAARVAVLPNQQWTSLVEVKSPIAGRHAKVGFLLYDGPTLVGSDYGPAVELNSTGYVALRHELRVGLNHAYDSIEFSVIFEEPQNQETYAFRKAALEQIDAEHAFYFDGSTPSPTGDYLWESIPFRSSTHFYSHRTSRSIRLRELLKDYLPNGACYALAFAQTVIPDTPRAIDGSDLDPSGFVPPPASGKSVRLRWSQIDHVGAELTTRYDVKMLTVGRELGLRWNQTVKLNTQLALGWNDFLFLKQVTNYRDILWAQSEKVGAQEALVWNDLQVSSRGTGSDFGTKTIVVPLGGYSITTGPVYYTTNNPYGFMPVYIVPWSTTLDGNPTGTDRPFARAVYSDGTTDLNGFQWGSQNPHFTPMNGTASLVRIEVITNAGALVDTFVLGPSSNPRQLSLLWSQVEPVALSDGLTTP